MALTEKEIEEMLVSGALKDSEQRVLVFLEKFGVVELPLTDDKKKRMPNASTISQQTGMTVTTVSQALRRMNFRGMVVYSRMGMQKKAILTEKGLQVVEYIKKVNKPYYADLKKETS